MLIPYVYQDSYPTWRERFQVRTVAPNACSLCCLEVTKANFTRGRIGVFACMCVYVYVCTIFTFWPFEQYRCLFKTGQKSKHDWLSPASHHYCSKLKKREAATEKKLHWDMCVRVWRIYAHMCVVCLYINFMYICIYVCTSI